MSYNTVTTANDFFEARLVKPSWENATSGNKTKALNMAYSILEKLNYLGEKAEEDQDSEFPRGDDTDVPTAILEAEALIAAALLDDFDIEQERNNLSMILHRYGQVTTSYDRSELPLHIIAGVPSYEAWLLLKPFIRDVNEIKLSRVS